MISNLSIKATDEKYYKSIRYFSHSLKGENRKLFITQVATHNLYLAAQCIMSAEKDNELEDYLAELCQNECNNKILNKRVQGFLGLIELNRFDNLYEVLSLIQKVEKEHRYTISRIIDEIQPEDIIKILRLLLNLGIRSLITSVITKVENKEVSFSHSQRVELDEIYTKLKDAHIPIKNQIRFAIAFNVSKNKLPDELFLKTMFTKFIQKNNYDLVCNFYEHYGLDFPFETEQLLNIYLGRNKQSSVFNFAKEFFKLKDEDKQKHYLRLCLKKGKYFTAFFFSLFRDMKTINNLLINIEHNERFVSLINPIIRKDFPEIDKTILFEIYDSVISRNEISIDDRVKCKVVYIIPKTIFVEILPTKIKGTIWIKHFETEKEDAREIVKIGEILDAKIIGNNEKYVQLTTK